MGDNNYAPCEFALVSPWTVLMPNKCCLLACECLPFFFHELIINPRGWQPGRRERWGARQSAPQYLAGILAEDDGLPVVTAPQNSPPSTPPIMRAPVTSTADLVHNNQRSF